MKKIFSIFALSALIFSGCNPTAQKNESTDTDKEEVKVENAVAQTNDNATASVIELEKDQVPEVSDLPVVIDCWATWCVPCMQFKPIFHKVAEEYADKFQFMTANIDSCSNMPDLYKFSAIPTVVILRKGQEPLTQTGSMSEEEFKSLLNSAL